MSNKRGQVTIFIIIAILIVASILIFFLWIKPNISTPSTAGNLGIETCMKDVIEQESGNLAKSAGYFNPEFYYTYQDMKIGYLCYTNLYFQPCINQEPLLKQNFERELVKASQEKINKCYDNSLNELKRMGYNVVGENKDLKISVDSNKISVELDAPVVLSKDSSSRFTKFNTEINSPIYNILMISTSIIQSETAFGDSDINSIMLLYPEYTIDKLKQTDGTTVYIIEDKQSKIKFQFATRSYALYPGYGTGTEDALTG